MTERSGGFVNDLIERQAAIDALNKLKIYRPLDSDRYVISDCFNKTRLLIPQPQRKTDMREDAEEPKKCDTCKHVKEPWFNRCADCSDFELWEQICEK